MERAVKLPDCPAVVWVGQTAAYAPLHRHTQHTKHSLWTVNVDCALAPNRGHCEQTLYDLCCVARHVLCHARQTPHDVILVYDTHGTQWSPLVGLLLLTELYDWDVTRAEHMLRLACARSNYRVLDGHRAVFPILSEWPHIQFVESLKRLTRSELQAVRERPLQPTVADPAVYCQIVPPTQAFRPALTALRTSLPVIAHHPGCGVRVQALFGTIHQTSFPRWPTDTSRAIALYACLTSEWLHVRRWGTKELDSIILNGMWIHRSATTENIMNHMYRQDECSDSSRNPVFTASLDHLLTACRRWEVTEVSTRLLLHTEHDDQYGAIVAEYGYWYWFEPRSCGRDKLLPVILEQRGGSSAFLRPTHAGCCLRRFETLRDLVRFASPQLLGNQWQVTKLHKKVSIAQLPERYTRPVIHPVPTRELVPCPPPIMSPVVIRQDSQSHEWRATAVLCEEAEEEEYPLQTPRGHVIEVSLLPRRSLRTTIMLLKGSRIVLPSLDTDDLFHLPAFFLTQTGHSVMCGHNGGLLLPFVRRTKQPDKANCTVEVINDTTLYLTVTKNVGALSELLRHT